MADEVSVEIREFHTNLRKIGWNISTEGIKECVEGLKQRDRTVENIAKWALNCDFKEIGFKVLTDEVKRGHVKVVKGPLVLQIQKIRNISAPKANEESGAAPRLLKLQLTDGHTTCFALEHSLIQKLSLSTPPGTKICLKGSVPLFCGFLLLESRQVDVLGGKVENLILKWETQKSVSQQRAKPGIPSDDGPPLFVAFDPKTSSGVKRTSASKPDHHNTHTSLSSHENTLNKKDENKKDENKKDENKKENAAFEHSRDQRILTAKQQRPSNPTKNENKTNKDHQVTGNQRRQQDYPSDRDQRRAGEDIAIKPSAGPKQETFRTNKSNVRDFADRDNGEKYVKTDYVRKSGSHKGGRRNDDFSDEYSTSRPSEGTLWDFLETKLPSKGSKTENVKPMHSAVGRMENDANQNIRQPSTQRAGQYRNQRANQQQNEKSQLEKGGYQDSRDSHRRNQDLHRPHERGGHVTSNKEVLDNQRNKESNQNRSQARSQQKHGHQSKDQHVDQPRKTPARSSHQNYSNEKEQVPEKKDDKHSNRNDTRFSNRSQQQAEVRYNNQGGKRGKDAGQQDNQRGDNYGKDFPKNEQKAVGRGSTHKGARVEDRTPNYRSKSYKDEEQEAVLTDQNNRRGEIDQSAHVNKKETGMDSKRSQQSRGKQNEHYGAASRRDVQQYKEHVDISKKEQENVNKRARNQHSDQSERYEETRPGGRRYEPRKQHWWKEGEDCMAFHSEHGQHYPARVIKVEVRLRSCSVIFRDTGRQELVNWSNLFPLDLQENRDNAFQFQENPACPPTATQNCGRQRNVSLTPQFDQSRPATSGFHAGQQRSQRPTQEFYRPPSGTKEQH